MPAAGQWLDGRPRIDTQSLRIRGGEAGVWHLQAPMLNLAEDSYRFSPFCWNGNHSGAVVAEDTGTAIAINGADFPLFLLEPWLNNAGKEFTDTGLASLKGELPKDFSALAGTGFVDLQVPFLKIAVKPNTENEVTRIENVHIEARWLGQRLTGKFSATLGQGGSIEGDLKTGFSDNAPLSGSLKVQVYNLAWLELFSLDISRSQPAS